MGIYNDTIRELADKKQELLTAFEICCDGMKSAGVYQLKITRLKGDAVTESMRSYIEKLVDMTNRLASKQLDFLKEELNSFRITGRGEIYYYQILFDVDGDLPSTKIEKLGKTKEQIAEGVGLHKERIRSIWSRLRNPENLMSVMESYFTFLDEFVSTIQ